MSRNDRFDAYNSPHSPLRWTLKRLPMLGNSVIRQLVTGDMFGLTAVVGPPLPGLAFFLRFSVVFVSTRPRSFVTFAFFPAALRQPEIRAENNPPKGTRDQVLRTRAMSLGFALAPRDRIALAPGEAHGRSW